MVRTSEGERVPAFTQGTCPDMWYIHTCPGAAPASGERGCGESAAKRVEGDDERHSLASPLLDRRTASDVAGCPGSPAMKQRNNGKTAKYRRYNIRFNLKLSRGEVPLW